MSPPSGQLGGKISEFPKPFRLPLRLHSPAIFSISWEDPEEKSAGGIIIPDTAKEKPSQGEVIAVGPGGRDESGKLIPIDLKEGDRVLFGKWSGTEVKIDGQELLIMKESDIMGIINEPVSKKKAA
jgi:chaperonin GroES